jgi:IS30 family transposase
VELRGQLSNPDARRIVRVVHDALARNPAKLTGGRQQAVRAAQTRPARRLGPAEVASLVERYQAGATARQLAGEFGVHRVTVGKLLRREGVRLRLDGLDPNQVEQAARLYAQGWSSARIGARLGVAPSTVWRGLISRGVRMRDTHGRRPSQPL